MFPAYVLTFDANDADAEGTMDPLSLPFDAAVTDLPANAFTRTGYTFTGWNTAADGSGVAYADKAEKVTLTADLTLYAQWKLNEYTITWKSDDGSVIDTTTVAYGKTPTHDAPTKAAEGDICYYTFDGWTPAIEAVTGDAAYTATFSAVSHKWKFDGFTWTGDDENGYTAVVALAEGRGNVIICTQEGWVVETPIEEALEKKKHRQMDRYKIMEARQLGGSVSNFDD